MRPVKVVKVTVQFDETKGSASAAIDDETDPVMAAITLAHTAGMDAATKRDRRLPCDDVLGKDHACPHKGTGLNYETVKRPVKS